MYRLYEFGGCILIVLVLLLNLTVGTWSFMEIFSWFGVTAPLVVSGLLGMFLGEISIPVACIGFFLKFLGVF